jgi:drug/metabolite transporter (DMT)-like permease
LGRLTVAGLLGMSGYQALLNLGETVVPAATASIIVATVPIITALLARILLREHLDKWRWIGILVAAAGIVVVTLGRGGRLAFEAAALLILAAAASLAGYFIVIKPLLLLPSLRGDCMGDVDGQPVRLSAAR